MYNLAPAIGEPRKYGAIDFEVDTKARKVEPPEFARGRIARTYMYFQKTYDLSISNKQIKLFKVWNKKYPITNTENLVYKKIHKLQGNKFAY